MGKLRVISGIAQNVPAYAGRSGFSFDLGHPPISVMMGALGSPPFSSGDYIAIAAKDSGFAGGVVSALAYRRVGQRGAAHITNPIYYVVGAGFGLLGLVLVGMLLFVRDPTGPDPSAIWAVSALLVGTGIYCTYQLRTMRMARRLLDDWAPPL
jgi:hypothetical protein